MRVLADDPHADADPVARPGRPVRRRPDPARRLRGRHRRPRAAARTGTRSIGGIAGSGKSGVLNVILGNLAACPDVVLWGIDLKGGMELRPWASCLARLATTPGRGGDAARATPSPSSTPAPTRSADDAERLWEPATAGARAGHRHRRVRRTGRARARRRRARRLDRPTRPSRRRRPCSPPPNARRRRPWASGARPLADGRPDLPARPGTPRRRPHPRPRHARRRLARPHPRRTRQVPASPPKATPNRAAPAPTSSPTTTYAPPPPATPRTGPISTRSRPTPSPTPSSRRAATRRRARQRTRPRTDPVERAPPGARATATPSPTSCTSPEWDAHGSTTDSKPTPTAGRAQQVSPRPLARHRANRTSARTSVRSRASAR